MRFSRRLVEKMLAVRPVSKGAEITKIGIEVEKYI